VGRGGEGARDESQKRKAGAMTWSEEGKAKGKFQKTLSRMYGGTLRVKDRYRTAGRAQKEIPRKLVMVRQGGNEMHWGQRKAGGPTQGNQR